ncbi:ubiquinol-cytochrome c reductase cytochrome c subunit [Streptosporangium becharense]|uniref:Cytochrome bc1 complex cytochrome c subunit n=1 Tax=Streptosporangium becharense TaxID=1816182 RepID=A0A7W9MFF7_9ACTN|nr:c-type cytochrome [Streptosporangium becharense]MBB2911894.1 ubiquinol-cytochrome c reductase cytochrome c subunit [Streptosporangium becharense]MBB5818441.1 ubiquinol-cytochrome c reductase cytochrome c subunit [Streptosporangium becharense]
MNRITAGRRHPLARYAVLLLALGLIGGFYTVALAVSSGQRADAAIASGRADDVAEGKKLFEQSCSSCHGLNAEGTSTGPTLVGVGSAAVHFQVSSGRMPLANPGSQAPRKQPAPWAVGKEGEKRIEQLGAYIQSLGGGPTAVSKADVDTSKANAAKGGELFRANCIQCHNFVGAGGALTQGKYAPQLNPATPEQIYEAMITGPQAMPVFNDSIITPDQKRDMIAYIVGVRQQVDPGGSGLGRIGPVTEGLVAWVVGLSLLSLAAIWITAKRRQAK